MSAFPGSPKALKPLYVDPKRMRTAVFLGFSNLAVVVGLRGLPALLVTLPLRTNEASIIN